MWGRLTSPSGRPFLLLAAIVLAFCLVDWGHGRFVNRATAFSVLQQFATIGPVALGLGLTMIAREFDLSVGSMIESCRLRGGDAGGRAPAHRLGGGDAGRRRVGRDAGRHHDGAAAELGRRDPGRPPHRQRHRLCAHRQHDHRLSPHGHRHAGERAGARHFLRPQHRGDRAVPRRHVPVLPHPRGPRRHRGRQRSARRPGRRRRRRPHPHRPLRHLRHADGARRRAVELQPGGRLAGRAGRCAGAGDRGRHHRRRVAVGRTRHAGRHRRRRAGAGGAALRPHRHWRAAASCTTSSPAACCSP